MGWIKLTRIAPQPEVIYDSRVEELKGTDAEKYILEFNGFIDRVTDEGIKIKAIMLRELAIKKSYEEHVEARFCQLTGVPLGDSTDGN